MGNTKVLYGVCGIGMGHTLRQQPIIDHLAKSSRVVIFAYGESYRHFGARYRGLPNVTVVQVSVPFYIGGAHGLDFAGTALRAGNFVEDTLAINCTAMAKAQALIGRPDLVITDYEPVAAQYAYSQDAPLVTIDQQSKYLVGEFPAQLHGEGFLDEVQRLRMFFPRAEKRFACSFFKVSSSSRSVGRGEGRLCDPRPLTVQLIPPVLSESILAMRRRSAARSTKDVLVYVSSQRDFAQSPAELVSICASQPNWRFHAFLPTSASAHEALPANVTVYPVGDPRFYEVLNRCAGIITTAGHSLLSEAMHLRKPVYALPLPVYEQQMNAHVIDVNGFGIARPHLTEPQLAEFLGGLPDFAAAIRRDKTALLRGSGHERIIAYLERKFLS
jgi:uncharacterized protein (TIGR00661 family)